MRARASIVWIATLAACGGAPAPPARARHTDEEAVRRVAVIATPALSLFAERVGDEETATLWVLGSIRARVHADGRVELAEDYTVLPLRTAVSLEQGWFFVDVAGTVLFADEFLGEYRIVEGVRGESRVDAQLSPYRFRFRAGRGRLVVSTEDGFASSTGGAFEPLAVPPHTDDVLFFDASFGVASRDGGLVERTDDGGRTWRGVARELPVVGPPEREERGIALPLEGVRVVNTPYGRSYHGPHVLLLPDGSAEDLDVPLGPQIADAAVRARERIEDASYRAFAGLLPAAPRNDGLVHIGGGTWRLIDAASSETRARGEARWNHRDAVPFGPRAFAAYDDDRWVRVSEREGEQPIVLPQIEDEQQPFDFAPDGSFVAWPDACGLGIGDGSGSSDRIPPPEGWCVVDARFAAGDDVVIRLANPGTPSELRVLDLRTREWRPLCMRPAIQTRLDGIARTADGDVVISGPHDALLRYFAVGNPRECLELVPLPTVVEEDVERPTTYAIAFADRLRGIRSATDGAWLTEDGGRTWQPVAARLRPEGAAAPTNGYPSCSRAACDLGGVAVRWNHPTPAPTPIGAIVFASDDEEEGLPPALVTAETLRCTENGRVRREPRGGRRIAGWVQNVFAESARALPVHRIAWRAGSRRASGRIAAGADGCAFDASQLLRALGTSERGALLSCEPDSSQCECRAPLFWVPAGGEAIPIDHDSRADGTVALTSADGTITVLVREGMTRVLRITSDGTVRASLARESFESGLEGLGAHDGEVRHVIAFEDETLVRIGEDFVSQPAIGAPLALCANGAAQADDVVFPYSFGVTWPGRSDPDGGAALVRVRLAAGAACVSGMTILTDDTSFELRSEGGALVGTHASSAYTQEVRCTLETLAEE